MPATDRRFCVVTPNFNMGRYLPETIDSVLANLRPGDEYHVIDGGSTDNSLDVLRSYGDRLTGWISEPDRSYADAVAKGFRRSTNELQCWIACGDLMLKGALDNARELIALENADMIFGDDLYVDEECRIIQVTDGSAPNLPVMMIHGAWTPLQDACFWRRDLYERVGGIDPAVRHAADYDLFLRMGVAGRCRYTPHVFSAFRRHPGQTSQQHELRYKQEKLACREKLLKSGAAPKPPSLPARAFYWVYPRLRSRFMNTKKVPAGLIGSHALAHASAATARFGGGR
jgi:glycosyltransferase involved in cell wall biosynthesis